jgi:hypothetical protein
MKSSPGAVVFIFILLLFLIAVAYYVGVSTDALALAKGFQQASYAVTGRNASGSFSGYPTGGGTAPAVSF